MTAKLRPPADRAVTLAGQSGGWSGGGGTAARVTGAESAGMLFYSVATVTCLLAVVIARVRLRWTGALD